MADLRAAIMALLTADATLAALLPGGIYDRPLRPPLTSDEAADPVYTPAAFDPQTGQVRPSAVVRVTSALVELGPLASREASVWLYEASPGRAAIEAAKWRVRDLLHQRQVATDREGAGVVLTWAGDLGEASDPELNAAVDQVRFTAGLYLGGA